MRRLFDPFGTAFDAIEAPIHSVEAGGQRAGISFGQPPSGFYFAQVLAQPGHAGTQRAQVLEDQISDVGPGATASAVLAPADRTFSA